MNFASGPEASPIASTASATASAMTGKSSVMPTAVTMLSTENTMSSATICATAVAKPSCTAPAPPSSSRPSTCSWISCVALKIRKKPPASSTRSRSEKPWSRIVNNGLVRPTSPASSPSSARRSNSATLRPRRRTAACRSGATRAVTRARKTRLSTPSTSSMATSVASAAQAAGSSRSAVMVVTACATRLRPAPAAPCRKTSVGRRRTTAGRTRRAPPPRRSSARVPP